MSTKLTLEHSASFNLVPLSIAAQVPLPPSNSLLAIHLQADNQGNESPSQAFETDTNPNYCGNFEASATTARHNISELPPVDTGFGAFSFLFAAFLVEALVWGFPNAYGVFLGEYLADTNYTSQASAGTLLPLVGTLSSGIIYCSSPFLHPFLARHPHTRRPVMLLGAILCVVSLLAASYTTQIHTLVFFQGVLYAMGGSLLYVPCISYMSEWFVKRRGMANGVIFAGTSFGGLVLPLILPPLLSKYGPPKTLRILSIGLACIITPVLPFVKGRIPHTRSQSHISWLPRRFQRSQRSTQDVIHSDAATATNNRAWIRDMGFWCFILANVLQGFGYFVPIVYLPTFASDLNLSAAKSALTLSLLNGASVVGRLSMGFMSDKYDPWLLAFSALSATALSVFVLWGVCATGFAGLAAFGLVYGALAAGWTSLYTGFIRPVAKDETTLSTSLLGYLMFTRGLGNILSAPISSVLLHGKIHVHTNTGFGVGDGRFGSVIVYVGVCFAASMMVIGWGLSKRKGLV